MDAQIRDGLLKEIAELDRRYRFVEPARLLGRRRNVASQTHGYREFLRVAGSTGKEALQWGIKSEWRGETRLRFADPGRTVIDVLDDPSRAGGIRHAAEITSAYLDEYAPEILIDYAERSGNHTVFKRLGYVIEALGLDQPHLVNASQDRLSAGISALDPDGPQGGRRNMRWRLRINATITPQKPSRSPGASLSSCAPNGRSTSRSSRRTTFWAGCWPSLPTPR